MQANGVFCNVRESTRTWTVDPWTITRSRPAIRNSVPMVNDVFS